MTTDNGALNQPPDVDSLEFVEDNPPAPQQPSAEEQPPTQEPQQPSRITFEIDENDIYGSIRQLSEKNPKVANVLNSMVGMKARTRYEPQLQQVQTELQNLKDQIERSRLAAVPEKERTKEQNEFLANDSSTERLIQTQVLNSVHSIVSSALDNGLDPAKGHEFLEALQNGKYDKDAQGNALSFNDSLALFNNDVMRALPRNAPRTEVPQVQEPQQPPSPQVTPPRDSANPDLNSAGGTQTRRQRYTKAEIESMTPDEFINAFPNDSDYEAAIASGEISGFSQETLDFLRTS